MGTFTERVLTYSSLEDPSHDEVAKINLLNYVRVKEISYGIALIEIEEHDLPRLSSDLPGWTVSQNIKLSY